jgi:HSP20 family protein
MEWIDNDEFEKMIDKMLKRLGLDSLNEKNQEKPPGVKSWYYGYSMRIGSDGKPVVREFGNLNPTFYPRSLSFPQINEADYKEPLTQVDINTEENKVRVLVEMPGVTKDSIKVNATETLVKINANHESRKYLTEVPIEARIDPDSADAKYNNGVLELNFELIESRKDEGVDIQIK